MLFQTSDTVHPIFMVTIIIQTRTLGLVLYREVVLYKGGCPL